MAFNPDRQKLFRAAGVYRLSCTGNKKFYIGSSVNLYSRIRDHGAKLLRGVHKNKHLQAAFNKYGAGCFEFQIEVLCAEEQIIAEEQRLLDALRPWKKEIGFNRCQTAETVRGIRWSAEARARKSVTSKTTGFPTAEQLRRSSEARRGTKRPDAVLWCKRNFSKPFRVQRWNDEIFEGVNRSEFARKMGISQGNLNEILLGHRPHCNGFHLPEKPMPEYRIKAPNGEIHRVFNMKKFSKEQHLNQTCLWFVCKGQRPHHKGYTLCA